MPVLRQLIGWGFLFALAASVCGAAEFVEFRFREPQPVAYRVQLPAGARVTAMLQPELSARTSNDATLSVGLTSRVVLRLTEGAEVALMITNRALTLDRTLAPQWFILQAPDAWTAAREAERLAALPEVLTCHPVRRIPMEVKGPYAPRPNDYFIQNQWNLENRDANGAPMGADLNVRAAWSFTRGEGVTIAVADNGVEIAHPDLAPRAANQPHYNFDSGNTNGAQLESTEAHGTAVAGLAVAQDGNGIGLSGVAPAAGLASWKMLNSSEEALRDMFQYMSGSVGVQNHSWLNSGSGLSPVTAMAEAGLSNALTFGRQGRGVIMVRACGNGRDNDANANEQAYTADPRVITVAGVRVTGRVASYSTPGACILVAAPATDGAPQLITTDRLGSLGYNPFGDLIVPNGADYAFGGTGPVGTSFSAPQVAGVCALLLSANTNLTIRDVQHILALASRHYDFADREVATNGAGLVVSQNVGFGVPDAGLAVRLARLWSNRPPVTTVRVASSNAVPIPDGPVVRATGAGVPMNLFSIPSRLPQEAIHPDDANFRGPLPTSPTASLPLKYVGLADSPIGVNLTNCGALIQRGNATFYDKIRRAQEAGAAYAIVFDNTTNSTLAAMVLDAQPLIPAVFIAQETGTNLLQQVQSNANLRVQVTYGAPASVTLAVTNEMMCEHVGVRLRTDHASRGNLRIVLTAPSGTRSILQHAAPYVPGGSLADWTYYSTHHFLEHSIGDWQVEVTDEEPGATGSLQLVELLVRGVPIRDSDRDGLDDDWELAKFGTLAYGPRDDPDGDGFSNAREQAIGSDPNQRSSPFPFALDASIWNSQLLRLSWPGAAGQNYDLRGGTNAGALSTQTNVSGRFPDGEVFVPRSSAGQFFQLRIP